MKYVAQIFGTVNPPPGVAKYTGITDFLNNILKVLIVAAGIYALINLIIAGYTFISAGGNPDKIASAWSKIWQTIMGLVIAAGSFVLAAVFGKIIFGDYNALLQIKVFGP